MLKGKFTKIKNVRNREDKEGIKDIFAKLGSGNGLIVINRNYWYSVFSTFFPPITPLLYPVR